MCINRSALPSCSDCLSTVRHNVWLLKHCHHSLQEAETSAAPPASAAWAALLEPLSLQAQLAAAQRPPAARPGTAAGASSPQKAQQTLAAGVAAAAAIMVQAVQPRTAATPSVRAASECPSSVRLLPKRAPTGGVRHVCWVVCGRAALHYAVAVRTTTATVRVTWWRCNGNTERPDAPMHCTSRRSVAKTAPERCRAPAVRQPACSLL